MTTLFNTFQRLPMSLRVNASHCNGIGPRQLHSRPSPPCSYFLLPFPLFTALQSLWLPCYAWTKSGPAYSRNIMLVTFLVWNDFPSDDHTVCCLTILRDEGLIQYGWLTSAPRGIIFAHSCFHSQLMLNDLNGSLFVETMGITRPCHSSSSTLTRLNRVLKSSR